MISHFLGDSNPRDEERNKRNKHNPFLKARLMVNRQRLLLDVRIQNNKPVTHLAFWLNSFVEILS